MTRPIYQVKAEFFKTLGHPVRIRVLEVLRDGEQAVSQILSQVGVEPSHLSQQLAILRRANIVRTRKEGTSVRYSVTEPRVFDLLEIAKTIIQSSLLETRELLEELEALDFEAPARRRRR